MRGLPHHEIGLLALQPGIVFSADGLVPLVNIWRRLRQRIFDSYHPELHYMRGPGPKWREKHAHAVSALSVSRYR